MINYDHIKRLIELNLTLIPIEKKGKKPANPPIYSWDKYQTEKPLEKDIKEWFDNDKGFNAGVVCGEISGNLVVVDIDLDGLFELMYPNIDVLTQNKEGDTIFFNEYKYILEQTMVIKTKYGHHVYFKIKDQVPDYIQLMFEGHEAISIRGEGRYVVAPNSVHSSGITYEIISDKSLKIATIDSLESFLRMLQYSLDNAAKKEPKYRVLFNEYRKKINANTNSEKFKSSAREVPDYKENQTIEAIQGDENIRPCIQILINLFPTLDKKLLNHNIRLCIGKELTNKGYTEDAFHIVFGRHNAYNEKLTHDQYRSLSRTLFDGTLKQSPYRCDNIHEFMSEIGLKGMEHRNIPIPDTQYTQVVDPTLRPDYLAPPPSIDELVASTKATPSEEDEEDEYELLRPDSLHEDEYHFRKIIDKDSYISQYFNEINDRSDCPNEINFNTAMHALASSTQGKMTVNTNPTRVLVQFFSMVIALPDKRKSTGYNELNHICKHMGTITLAAVKTDAGFLQNWKNKGGILTHNVDEGGRYIKRLKQVGGHSSELFILLSEAWQHDRDEPIEHLLGKESISIHDPYLNLTLYFQPFYIKEYVDFEAVQQGWFNRFVFFHIRRDLIEKDESAQTPAQKIEMIRVRNLIKDRKEFFDKIREITVELDDACFRRVKEFRIHVKEMIKTDDAYRSIYGKSEKIIINAALLLLNDSKWESYIEDAYNDNTIDINEDDVYKTLEKERELFYIQQSEIQEKINSMDDQDKINYPEKNRLTLKLKVLDEKIELNTNRMIKRESILKKPVKKINMPLKFIDNAIELMNNLYVPHGKSIYEMISHKEESYRDAARYEQAIKDILMRHWERPIPHSEFMNRYWSHNAERFHIAAKSLKEKEILGENKDNLPKKATYGAWYLKGDKKPRKKKNSENKSTPKIEKKEIKSKSELKIKSKLLTINEQD